MEVDKRNGEGGERPPEEALEEEANDGQQARKRVKIDSSQSNQSRESRHRRNKYLEIRLPEGVSLEEMVNFCLRLLNIRRHYCKSRKAKNILVNAMQILDSTDDLDFVNKKYRTGIAQTVFFCGTYEDFCEETRTAGKRGAKGSQTIESRLSETPSVKTTDAVAQTFLKRTSNKSNQTELAEKTVAAKKDGANASTQTESALDNGIGSPRQQLPDSTNLHTVVNLIHSYISPNAALTAKNLSSLEREYAEFHRSVQAANVLVNDVETEAPPPPPPRIPTTHYNDVAQTNKPTLEDPRLLKSKRASTEARLSNLNDQSPLARTTPEAAPKDRLNRSANESLPRPTSSGSPTVCPVIPLENPDFKSKPCDPRIVCQEVSAGASDRSSPEKKSLPKPKGSSRQAELAKRQKLKREAKFKKKSSGDEGDEDKSVDENSSEPPSPPPLRRKLGPRTPPLPPTTSRIETGTTPLRRPKDQTVAWNGEEPVDDLRVTTELPVANLPTDTKAPVANLIAVSKLPEEEVRDWSPSSHPRSTARNPSPPRNSAPSSLSFLDTKEPSRKTPYAKQSSPHFDADVLKIYSSPYSPSKMDDEDSFRGDAAADNSQPQPAPPPPQSQSAQTAELFVKREKLEQNQMGISSSPFSSGNLPNYVIGQEENRPRRSDESSESSESSESAGESSESGSSSSESEFEDESSSKKRSRRAKEKYERQKSERKRLEKYERKMAEKYDKKGGKRHREYKYDKRWFDKYGKYDSKGSPYKRSEADKKRSSYDNDEKKSSSNDKRDKKSSSADKKSLRDKYEAKTDSVDATKKSDNHDKRLDRKSIDYDKKNSADIRDKKSRANRDNKTLSSECQDNKKTSDKKTLSEDADKKYIPKKIESHDKRTTDYRDKKSAPDKKIVADYQEKKSDKKIVADYQEKKSDKKIVEDYREKKSDKKIVEDYREKKSDKKIVEDYREKKSDKKIVADNRENKLAADLKEKKLVIDLKEKKSPVNIGEKKSSADNEEKKCASEVRSSKWDKRTTHDKISSSDNGEKKLEDERKREGTNDKTDEERINEKETTEKGNNYTSEKKTIVEKKKNVEMFERLLITNPLRKISVKPPRKIHGETPLKRVQVIGKKPLVDYPIVTTENQPTTPTDATPMTSIDGTLTTPIDGTLMTPIHGTPMTPIHGTPMTPIHGTPMTPIHGTPMTQIHGTPMTPIHGTPMTPIHGTPMTQIHGTPMTLIHGTPMTLIHGTPMTSIHGTPMTPIHGTPMTPIHGTFATTIDGTPTTPDDDKPVEALDQFPPDVRAPLSKSPVPPEPVKFFNSFMPEEALEALPLKSSSDPPLPTTPPKKLAQPPLPTSVRSPPLPPQLPATRPPPLPPLPIGSPSRTPPLPPSPLPTVASLSSDAFNQFDAFYNHQDVFGFGVTGGVSHSDINSTFAFPPNFAGGRSFNFATIPPPPPPSGVAAPNRDFSSFQSHFASGPPTSAEFKFVPGGPTDLSFLATPPPSSFIGPIMPPVSSSTNDKVSLDATRGTPAEFANFLASQTNSFQSSVPQPVPPPPPTTLSGDFNFMGAPFQARGFHQGLLPAPTVGGNASDINATNEFANFAKALFDGSVPQPVPPPPSLSFMTQVPPPNFGLTGQFPSLNNDFNFGLEPGGDFGVARNHRASTSNQSGGEVVFNSEASVDLGDENSDGFANLKLNADRDGRGNSAFINKGANPGHFKQLLPEFQISPAPGVRFNENTTTPEFLGVNLSEPPPGFFGNPLGGAEFFQNNRGMTPNNFFNPNDDPGTRDINFLNINQHHHQQQQQQQRTSYPGPLLNFNPRGGIGLVNRGGAGGSGSRGGRGGQGSRGGRRGSRFGDGNFRRGPGGGRFRSRGNFNQRQQRQGDDSNVETSRERGQFESPNSEPGSFKYNKAASTRPPLLGENGLLEPFNRGKRF